MGEQEQAIWVPLCDGFVSSSVEPGTYAVVDISHKKMGKRLKKLRKRCELLAYYAQQLELEQRIAELEKSRVTQAFGFCAQQQSKNTHSK